VPAASAAAFRSNDARLRHKPMTATATARLPTACTVHASCSLPPSGRTKPNRLCKRFQSAWPSVSTTPLVIGIQCRKVSQLAVPKASQDAAARPTATKAATAIVSQRRSAISTSGNSKPNCGL